MRDVQPRVIVVRRALVDGYSDDVIALAAAAAGTAAPRIVVLLPRTEPAAQEARQIALGAESVHRDPVRADVLAAYLARYRAAAVGARRPLALTVSRNPFRFAGATVDPVDRHLTRGTRSAALTPREVALAELLAESRGRLVSYPTRYGEILERRFAGDTSNLRVLLAKLGASFRAVGLELRRHVEVVPKLGYRYTAPHRPALRLAKPRGGNATQAA